MLYLHTPSLTDKDIVFYPYRKALVKRVIVEYRDLDYKEYSWFQKKLVERANKKYENGEIVDIEVGTAYADNHTVFDIGDIVIGFENNAVWIGTGIQLM